MYKGLPNQPFPPIYRTKFVSEVIGYINTTASNNNGSAYPICGNSCYLPWYIGNSVSISNATATWPNMSLTASTLTPMGFPNICDTTNGPYTICKVKASKCFVQIVPNVTTPSVGNESLVCALYPLPTDYRLASSPTSNAAVAAASLSQALTFPYVKSGMYDVYQRMQGPLKSYMTTAQLFGVTKRAIEDDPTSAFTHQASAYPANWFVWMFHWAYPDSSTTVNFTYRVKLTYYVELSNLLPSLYEEVSGGS